MQAAADLTVLAVLWVIACTAAAGALVVLAYIAITICIDSDRHSRRQLIRWEELNAELEMQRSLQHSVAKMFEAARQANR